MNTQEKIYWNALHDVFDLGAKDVKAMMRLSPSSKKIWRCSRHQLERTGIRKSIAERWALRKLTDPHALWRKLEKHSIHVIHSHESAYPKTLREIASPPPWLYARGNISLLQQEMFAIVGTRRATSYGKHHAEHIARELSRFGLIIVSGLAFGIDIEAHKATLEFDNRTIAVLGSGVDSASVTPYTHQKIADALIERGGLILSEHPVGRPPSRQSFPRRNRIISGLSRGVLIVEAARKSGAMITAEFALEQNRDVFALPGDVGRTVSEGTNFLIQQGAKLITSGSDILIEYGYERNPVTTEGISNEASTIIALIKDGHTTFDQLLITTGLPYPQLQSVLLNMELAGNIAKKAGMYYNIEYM